MIGILTTAGYTGTSAAGLIATTHPLFTCTGRNDILARRTRISIDTWDRGEAAAQEVADLVAPLLGWNSAAVADEVEHYRARVAAERESQVQPDDRTADAARLGAPDVRVESRLSYYR